MAATPPVAAVLVDGVSHAYERAPVLRDVSLAVAPGEIVALTGANGAGKTTLLRLIASLDQPVRGRIAVCGHDARAERRRVRARVGFVAHPPILYPDLTVAENLRFFAALFGRFILPRIVRCVQFLYFSQYFILLIFC